MNVLEVVRKVAEGDERTAKIMVRELLYDALVTEVERVRPQLEADVSKALGQSAARSLQTLAKSQSAGREQVAGHLASLVLLSKATPDNKTTPFWDARNPDGTFASGSLRQRTADGLSILTRQRDDDLGDKGGVIRQAVQGDQYARARMLGNALTSINTPETRAVGTLARVIGEIGPEAHDVLEPGLRRLAYRYRGTEKRPDPGLQQAAALLARASEGEIPTEGGGARAVARWRAELSSETRRDTMQTAGMKGGGQREKISPGAAAFAVLAGEERGGTLTPDQRRLDAVGTLGVLALRKQVPDPALADISRQAGRMPPSVGLMMDSRGRVVSEAMGFNGDHYLPFDLKNLKGLQGGQYVRTRTGGGPTDEDIYTGLMSGARQIQVVSNSGVFTLEFDPSLRGGRRYSDKAKQMVDRYGKLVSTIESGNVTANPLPREKITELRTQAMDEAQQNPELAETYFKDKVLQEQARQKFAAIDDDELMDQAREIADTEWKDGQKGNKPASSTRTRLQTQREVFQRLKSEAMAERYRTYKADGEGYHAALKALQQEFPYFIRRVDREPLGDYLLKRKQLSPDEAIPGRGGKDPGYTRPGGLAPAGVNDGTVTGRYARTDRAKAPAAAESSANTSPAATGEAQPATAPAQQAPAAAPAATGGVLTQLATPSREVVRRLHSSLGDALGLRRILNDARDAPPGETMETIHQISSPDEWAGFVLDHESEVGGLSTWLLDPKTNPLNLQRAESTLTAYRDMVKREQAKGNDGWEALDVGTFEQALDTVQKVRMMREPFAAKTPDVMEVQSAPYAFPDVLEGDPAAYAKANPEVAQAADAMIGTDDKVIAQELADQAEDLRTLLNGDPQKNQAARRAQLAIGAGQQPPEVKALEVKHRAWTLHRARTLLAFQRGEDPAPFGKAAPRRPLRVVQPGSPVAKAYASSLARSRKQPMRPASR